MEPKGSLPQSQVPTTCPYPEPFRSSPYPHIPLPEDPSKYYPPIYAWVSQVVSFLQVSSRVTLIALVRQRERASMWPYTYTACLGYVLFCVPLWFFFVRSQHFPFDCHQPTTECSPSAIWEQTTRKQIPPLHDSPELFREKKSYGWFKVNRLKIKHHSLKAYRRRWSIFPRILESGI